MGVRPSFYLSKHTILVHDCRDRNQAKFCLALTDEAQKVDCAMDLGGQIYGIFALSDARASESNSNKLTKNSL